MADETTKRQAQALRDWIDSDGKPLESGKENEVTAIRYVHLPTAKRLNPAFNPEADEAEADAVFEFDLTKPEHADAVRMLAAFGALTLAGNIVNSQVNGPKGDPNINPIPGVSERFDEIAKGIWAERATGVGGVRYNADQLALAIAQAKGESDPAPYLAKMAHKVDPKTGAVVAADTKGAISYGAFALRNGAVKSHYDKLAGTGAQLSAL